MFLIFPMIFLAFWFSLCFLFSLFTNGCPWIPFSFLLISSFFSWPGDVGGGLLSSAILEMNRMMDIVRAPLGRVGWVTEAGSCQHWLGVGVKSATAGP